MSIVQLSLVGVESDPQPRASRPVFELDLGKNQRVVAVEHYWTVDRSTRETVDHIAKVWVETRL